MVMILFFKDNRWDTFFNLLFTKMLTPSYSWISWKDISSKQKGRWSSLIWSSREFLYTGEFCSYLNGLWRATDCWWFLQFFCWLIPLTLEGISFRNNLWKYFTLWEVIVCTSCVLYVSIFRNRESLYVAMTLILIKLKGMFLLHRNKVFFGFL